MYLHFYSKYQQSSRKHLSKKVYDMLNRIAVSGGTYQDWVETVYTSSWNMHTETPMYEGGMSSEIEFQEVVSNSASGDEPLGTLAGRGINTLKKGGKLHIKVTDSGFHHGMSVCLWVLLYSGCCMCSAV